MTGNFLRWHVRFQAGCCLDSGLLSLEQNDTSKEKDVVVTETSPTKRVWLDGNVVTAEDANISIYTESAMRGANVYEGLRAYWSDERANLYVWKLDDHLARLFQSMKIMRMTPPYSREVMREAILEWARANDFREDVHFRLVAYFGKGGGFRAFRPDEIETGAWIAGGPRKHDDQVRHGLNLCVSSWRRITDESSPPRVKAGANYQNSRLAAMEARTNGYDDAIILTPDGKVSEATGASLLLVRDGILVSPNVTSGILESITRQVLLELFESQYGTPARERSVDRTELYIADEALICGSAEEATPVVSVDRIPVGDGLVGPMTKQLQKLFFAATRGEDPNYAADLTPVY